MKKIIALMFVFLLSPIVGAVSFPDGWYGQNQYYYVIFDGEGEAAVLARLELQNTENLTEFSFQIPGEDIHLINIVQEYYEYTEECLNWEEVSCTTEGIVETCSKECREYVRSPINPPSYAQISYTIGEADGITNIQLDIPEQDQEDTILLLYYKTRSYVTESGGVFSYTFRTIQNPYDTNKVRVSLDVAEDLYLEGASSAIDYQKEVFATEESADFARVSSTISSINTGYTVRASSLDAYESFTVEGKYAQSWWNIHWWKAAIAVLFVCAALGGIVYGIRACTRKDKKLGLPLLLGAASGAFLFGIWAGSAFLLSSGAEYFLYNEIGILFMVLLTLLMSLFLLVAPAVWVGYTEGVKYGMICFIATVLTLFLFAVLVLGWLFFFSTAVSSGFIFD